MAAIEGFTETQNAALQGVTVGCLLFIQKAVAYDSDEDDDGLDSDNDEDDGENEGKDEGAFGMEQNGTASATEGNGTGPTANELSTTAHAHTNPVQTSPDAAVASSGQAEALDGSDNTESQSDGAVTDAETFPNAAATASDNDDDEPSETAPFVPTMYIITSMIKGGDGNNITELEITPLSFNHKVGSLHGEHSYHIFGNECKVYHDCEGPCKKVTSITTVATGEHYILMVNPAGDYVRRIVHGARRCIDTCKDGFLDNTSCLSDMVKDYVPEILDYEQNVAAAPACLQKPVCPVCIGPALLREQQALQQGLMATSVVDLGLVIEYLGKLNVRKQVIRSTMGGYRFVQFDERQWGHGFEDMLDDEDNDDDDDGGDDSGQFEHWEEARDPNANPKLRPASDETIAALPRKQRSEITFEGNDETCCVDREAFESDSVLVQLPCGHAKFHESCIVTWLKQYNNCPICREVVLDANTEEQGKGPNHKAAMLRMSLEEALTSLGFEAGTDIHTIDKDMLPVIFANAREDRAGWRTETSIARLEAELAMRKDAAERDDGLGDDNTVTGDSEPNDVVENECEEEMEVIHDPQHLGLTDESKINSDPIHGFSGVNEEPVSSKQDVLNGNGVAESQDSIMSDESG